MTEKRLQTKAICSLPVGEMPFSSWRVLQNFLWLTMAPMQVGSGKTSDQAAFPCSLLTFTGRISSLSQPPHPQSTG